jgi:hypothetical protein
MEGKCVRQVCFGILCLWLHSGKIHLHLGVLWKMGMIEAQQL